MRSLFWRKGVPETREATVRRPVDPVSVLGDAPYELAGVGAHQPDAGLDRYARTPAVGATLDDHREKLAVRRPARVQERRAVPATITGSAVRAATNHPEARPVRLCLPDRRPAHSRIVMEGEARAGRIERRAAREHHARRKPEPALIAAVGIHRGEEEVARPRHGLVGHRLAGRHDPATSGEASGQYTSEPTSPGASASLQGSVIAERFPPRQGIVARWRW